MICFHLFVLVLIVPLNNHHHKRLDGFYILSKPQPKLNST